ncbi:MAG: FMN-binding protein [candidate division KSB1 bacterium]|nr:FMN-binding protein [candidate division KSB1 bacterium]
MKAILVFVFLLITHSVFAGLQEKAEQKLMTWDSDLDVLFKRYTLPQALESDIEKKSSQKFLQDFVYLWTLEKQGFSAFAIADAVRARSALISTLIVIDSSCTVVYMDILNYHGHYGRQIIDRRWFEQFYGVSIDSEQSLDRKIDAISGATSSSNAVSRGVRRWLIFVDELYKNQETLLDSSQF